MTLGVLAVSLIYNLAGIGWGLPDNWYGDERLLALEAVNLDQGRRLCPQTYYYGTLPKYVLAGFYAPYLSGRTDVITDQDDNPGYAGALWRGRILFALFAALAAAVFFRVLIKICSLPAAGFGALLFALAPTFVNSAHFIKNTSMLALFYCLCLFCASQFLLTGRKKYLYACSLVCGLSLGIQITGSFVFIMLLVPTLLYFSGRLDGQDRLKPWKEMATVIAVEGGLAFLGLALGFPCLFRDPTAVIYQTYAVTMSVKQGLGILYPFGYRQIPWLLFTGSGFVGLVLALSGMVWYLAEKKPSLPRSSRLMANYLLLPAIIFFCLSYSTVRRIDLRYLVPYLPFFLAFAAMFADALLRRAALRTAAIAAMAAAILWLAGLSAAVDYYFIHDTRYQARAWIEKNLPPDARIETTSWLFNFGHSYHPQLVDWKYHEPVLPVQVMRLAKRIKCPSGTCAAGTDPLQTAADYEGRWQQQLQQYLYDFSPAGLAERDPGYIVASSGFYDRYLKYPNQYPSTRTYWQDLLAGKLGYRVIKKFAPPRIIGVTTEIVCPEIVILQKGAP